MIALHLIKLRQLNSPWKECNNVTTMFPEDQSLTKAGLLTFLFYL